MRLIAFIVPAAVLLVSRAAAAQESSASSSEESEEGAPPKRYPPSSVRPRLVIGGLAVTGIGYGVAMLAASSAAPDLPGIEYMQIPVAGPFISLATMACPADDPDCGFLLYLRGFLTIADGLMQLGGLGIAGEGIFMTTEADAPARRDKQGIVLRPAPIVTGTTAGIGLVGTF